MLLICRTDTRWLWSRPQLEILDSIIGTHTVDVVNTFGWQELTTKLIFHRKPVTIFRLTVHEISQVAGAFLDVAGTIGPAHFDSGSHHVSSILS